MRIFKFTCETIRRTYVSKILTLGPEATVAFASSVLRSTRRWVKKFRALFSENAPLKYEQRLEIFVAVG